MNKQERYARQLKATRKQAGLTHAAKQRVLKTLQPVNLEDTLITSDFTSKIWIQTHSMSICNRVRRELRTVMPEIRLKLSDFSGIADSHGDMWVTLSYSDVKDNRVKVTVRLREEEIPPSLIPKSCHIETKFDTGYVSPATVRKVMVCNV